MAGGKTTIEEEARALLERVPKDGRGIGNGTLMRELAWPEKNYKVVCDYLLKRGELARGPGRGGSVKLPSAAREEDELLAHVPPDGSPISNVALQRKLRWDDNRYYAVRDRLLDDGVLARGRGRGGTVRRVQAEAMPPETKAKASAPSARPLAEKEEALYAPIALVLRDAWGKERRFHWSRVEETAKQGRRDTGGRWSRPDLAVISLNKYQYLPGLHVDVWTFEVKTIDGLDVTAVYEALAHSRFATRAYVAVKIPDEPTADQTERLEAAQEEAARHGIGMITMTDSADHSTWDETVEPKRFDSDPERVNEFIATQFSADVQSELQIHLR